MLNYTNLAANIGEPRYARTEQRARATLADHERTRLSARDREMVLSALESPAEPTAALREMMTLHKESASSDV